MPVFMPLTAGRAMDVRRVAQQKRPTFPEMLRHTVMDVIGREPIHPENRDFQVFDCPVADVLEF
jgi:hypothetical protein